MSKIENVEQLQEIDVDSKKSKKKTIPYEERLYESYKDKVSDIRAWKSRFFYTCLIILNVCTLLVAFIWLNLNKDIDCFELLGQVWDTKTFFIMLAIFILIQLLYAVPNFLKLYNKQKNRRFWAMFGSNAVGKFYECVTLYKAGEVVCASNYLVEKGISQTASLSLTHSKKIIERLSFWVLSIVIMLIGAFAWVENINIWIYLLAFVSLMVESLYLVFLIIFAKNKKKGLAILGRICKILFDLKMVKDYESFYNKMVDKMMVNSKAFSQDKFILITEIASALLITILRILILYVSLYTLSSSVVDRIWQLAFSFVVMELVINILPLQKGTLAVEILFIMLFAYVFTDSYVFFGLMFYKIFEYFMYVIQFALVWLIDKIKLNITKKK